MIRLSKKPAAAAAAAVVAAALSLGGAGSAAPLKLSRLGDVTGTTAPAFAMVRTPDGTLHLVYQTVSGTSVTGLTTMSISPSGKAGQAVLALSGWHAGQAGLVRLPNGSIEAIFGAVSPGNVSSVWGIISSDGGTTWTIPADVRGGGSNEALAYGADVTAAMGGATPVLALPQAGNLVVQTGLGLGSPSAVVTNTGNGSLTDADVAVDAATKAVVAGWQSIAHDPTLYVQGVAPSLGAVQKVPGQSRNALVLAGRDTGPGVFGAYTSDGAHVRLFRYGGGSVAVGSRAGTTAKVLGVATGLDGRIWVMWGDDAGGGVAVTRSNKAVTRFEPIQHVTANLLSIYRVAGDGRLGPLDLLVDGILSAKGPVQSPGLFHATVLPVLAATSSVKPVKNKQGTVVAHKLTVTVSDAGDPVSGATVSAAGKTAKTSGNGVAVLQLPASTTGSVSVTVTSPGYSLFTQTVHI